MSATDLYDIGTYSNQTQVVLHWLLQATQDAAHAKETPEFIISLIGVVLNIFHLIILTRKSMRSTSINVLMIGIAFSDLFIMIYGSYRYILTYIITYSECSAPWSYFRTVADVLVYSMKDGFRRVSSWLGVLMAVIRFLIIKNPLDPKFDFLSRPSFGWKVILIVIALSSFFSVVDTSPMQIIELSVWTPPEQCTGYPENFTAIEYFSFISVRDDDLWLEQIVMVGQGVSKIIPATLLPILTFLLIQELKKAAKTRKKLTSEAPQKDHTTKLVILMTVSFMIAEGPFGLVFVAEGLLSSAILSLILSNIYIILTIFVALNATTHCLICMTMSSQYRTCVRSLFCKKSKPKMVTVFSKVSVVSVRNVTVTI